MDYRTITLHGGPWNGRVINLDSRLNHFHIQEPTGVMFGQPETYNLPASYRTGTYSQVSGPQYKTDFEWDGWSPS